MSVEPLPLGISAEGIITLKHSKSRLRTIIHLLGELVVGASGDPELHLVRLRRDKDKAVLTDTNNLGG